MRKRDIQIDANLNSVSQGVSFIKEALSVLKVSSKDSIKAQLLAEEFLVSIISARSEEDAKKIGISVIKTAGKKKILISFAGREIEDLENVGLGVDLSEGEMSPDTEEVIRRTIISAHESSYSTGYKNGVNRIYITVGESTKKDFRTTLYAICAAIIAGLIFRLIIPREISSFINTNILETVKTLFINILTLLTGPVVFFSIASCISTFSDMKELGRTAIKIVSFYIFTSIVAIGVGVLFLNIFNPGTFGEFAGQYGEVAATVEATSASDTLTGLIPNNFVTPFITMNTLQIIIMALLLGIGAAKMGDKTKGFSDVLKSLNELFLKITGLIIRFLPMMVFSSVCSLVITIDLGNLKSLIWLVICTMVAFIAMMTLYVIIVMITTKTNPITYFKKVFPAWLNAFALQSSSASMPYTMEICRDNLKISPKVYSFAIPLGATINMDGFTIGLTIWMLFFLKVFGITLNTGEYISLFFTILVVCMGAPGIPGSGIICTSMIMSQIGIPQAALPIFISMYTVVDPLETSNNVFGDITGAFVIAKRNGLVEEWESSQ